MDDAIILTMRWMSPDDTELWIARKDELVQIHQRCGTRNTMYASLPEEWERAIRVLCGLGDDMSEGWERARTAVGEEYVRL